MAQSIYECVPYMCTSKYHVFSLSKPIRNKTEVRENKTDDISVVVVVVVVK